jgi:hypothetical protein
VRGGDTTRSGSRVSLSDGDGIVGVVIAVQMSCKGQGRVLQ